jgi:hypothetical protein
VLALTAGIVLFVHFDIIEVQSSTALRPGDPLMPPSPDRDRPDDPAEEGDDGPKVGFGLSPLGGWVGGTF